MLKMSGPTSPGDLDLVGIGELHPVPDPGAPRAGLQQSDTGIIRDAVVSIRDGRIVAFGSRDDVRIGEPGVPTLDAGGAVVAPGLVESHAHPLYAGNRSHEYAGRLQGLPAGIIGGDEESGIKYTVRETRRASDEYLAAKLHGFLSAAMDSGITSCEVKGGYGLTLDEELRYLEIAHGAAETSEMRISPTFAAAHDVPMGVKAEAHVDEICRRMLPIVAERFPGGLNDVTCESGILTPDQALRILREATRLGLRNKVHADAFSDSGGWRTAVTAGALSADHLTYTPVEAVAATAGARTVATVLPLAELTYMTDRRAPASAFIEHEVPVAIATDYCSSIGSTSLLRAMLMAAPWFGMSPDQSLVATTLNAAYALGVAEECGSVDIGKSGDLVVFGQPTLNDVFWSEPVAPTVIRAGDILRWGDDMIRAENTVGGSNDG